MPLASSSCSSARRWEPFRSFPIWTFPSDLSVLVYPVILSKRLGALFMWMLLTKLSTLAWMCVSECCFFSPQEKLLHVELPHGTLLDFWISYSYRIFETLKISPLWKNEYWIGLEIPKSAVVVVAGSHTAAAFICSYCCGLHNWFSVFENARLSSHFSKFLEC